MIRQFLNSGFTPSGGPGLHTLDALRTFMSAALTGGDLGQRDTMQYMLKAMNYRILTFPQACEQQFVE